MKMGLVVALLVLLSVPNAGSAQSWRIQDPALREIHGLIRPSQGSYDVIAWARDVRELPYRPGDEILKLEEDRQTVHLAFQSDFGQSSGGFWKCPRSRAEWPDSYNGCTSRVVKTTDDGRKRIFGSTRLFASTRVLAQQDVDAIAESIRFIERAKVESRRLAIATLTEESTLGDVDVVAVSFSREEFTPEERARLREVTQEIKAKPTSR